MKKKTTDDAVDLIEIFEIILKNKLKVFLITLFFLLIGVGYQATQKSEFSIKAVTEISPISTFQENLYYNYNSYAKKYFINIENLRDDLNNINKEKAQILYDYKDYYNLNKDFMLNLFISKLNERKLFIEAMIENDFIDKNNYASDNIYQEEILKLVSSINLNPPILNKLQPMNLSNWKIEFQTTDIKKWEKILNTVEDKANSEIQKFLNDYFNFIISSEIKQKNYMIEDIDIKISSVIEKYENEMLNRIAYLTEQSNLARALNIKSTNSTYTTTTVWSPENEDLKLRTELPYYMRGYEIIEKEIELIKNRINKESFIQELPTLNEKKKLLIESKNIERLIEIFKGTPITNKEVFSAGKILTSSTKYETNTTNKRPLIMLSFIFGLVFSVLLVIMQDNFKKKKRIK